MLLINVQMKKALFILFILTSIVWVKMKGLFTQVLSLLLIYEVTFIGLVSGEYRGMNSLGSF